MRFSIEEAKKHFKGKQVTCAEIGSCIGNNAKKMLDTWDGLSKLYLVDSFDTCPDFKDPAEQEKNKKSLLDRFKDEPRVKIILKKSVETAKRFKDESIDFIYIDANHTYKAVMDDVTAWTPKVKKGGIIGGHDYEYFCPTTNTRSVKDAVDEFYGKENINCGIVVMTVDYDSLVLSVSCDWWVYI